MHFTLSCPFTAELKVDQSVSHNGVCLTVVEIADHSYTVTAIKETLERTNLGRLSIGSTVNLERCMRADGRFDGHIVQGHVDEVVLCEQVTDLGGSHAFTFRFQDAGSAKLVVEKGSVCLNGVSLTVVKCTDEIFSVHIIPYTLEHTGFGGMKVGDAVNVEYDVIGKYVMRMVRR
jgi:riboflavin synthase